MTGSLRRIARELVGYWPLLYLGWLVFQPALYPVAGVWDWVTAGASIAVFVPVYVLAQRRTGRIRRWSPALATVIGLLAFIDNSGAVVFFIYAAALAGSHLTRQASTRWLVGLTALIGVLAAVSEIPFPWRLLAFTPALALVWIIGLTCVEAAERCRAQEAMRVENARVAHLATLTERERIARDLHDLLGQTLTGIVVRSQLAQRLARADADAGTAEMAEVERMARAALAEVRSTVAGWRHVGLDDELAVAGDALAAAGVELVVVREDDLVLAPSAETALALALREAVTNVVRHAEATRATVALRRADGRVVLEVADDGIGGAAREGGGLTGMRERVGALGGEVQRRAGGGSALTVTVPAAVAT